MPEQYEVPIKRLEQLGIEPKKGVKLALVLKNGQSASATITKVAKDHVIIVAEK